jgi:hypothetical protein
MFRYFKFPNVAAINEVSDYITFKDNNHFLKIKLRDSEITCKVDGVYENEINALRVN